MGPQLPEPRGIHEGQGLGQKPGLSLVCCSPAGPFSAWLTSESEGSEAISQDSPHSKALEQEHLHVSGIRTQCNKTSLQLQLLRATPFHVGVLLKNTEPATDITKRPEGWQAARAAAWRTPTSPEQQADLEAETMILDIINTRKTREAEIKTTCDFITLCTRLPNQPG